jgi:hypothetical protein
MNKKLKGYLLQHNGKADAADAININQFLDIHDGEIKG